MTLIGGAVYGVDTAPPDPAVPAAEVEAALAGIALALLAERFPGDGGAEYLARLGALASVRAHCSGEDP